MSQAKVQSRWQPPASLQLRDGQRQVIEHLNDPQSKARKCGQIIVVQPTGYGKTISICLAYASLRDQNIVQRMMIIVPSAEQFDSYLKEIEQNMARVGARISGAYRAVSDLSLKFHRQNEAEVFVTTIQTLSSSGSAATINDLLSSGRWLLAADEFHRYADTNTWGDALKNLRPSFTIAVSATPQRTDKSSTAIMGKADVLVKLPEAVEEGAIRRVVTHVMDYQVDLVMGGDPEPERFTLSELAEAVGGSGKMQDLSQVEIKREIRYLNKYLSESLVNTVQRLDDLNNAQPGQHKMLVFALGVKHAQAICEQLQYIAPNFKADWIGTMSTDKHGNQFGRNDSENELVLSQFKEDELQILVQVRKATEGFNDVKCSVLVFLNLLSESVLLQQCVGRGLRRNYAIPEETDRCHVFASHDHPGIEYLKKLAEETAKATDPEEEVIIDERTKTGGHTGPLIYDIPEFFIIDASFSGEELYFPLGGQMLAQSKAAETVRTFVPDLDNQTDENVLELIRQALGVQPKIVSTTEKIERAKDRVTKAVGTLASNVVRIRADRSGGTFPKSMLGDTCKAIHTRWKRLNGGQGQSEMTVEDLERKHKWIKAINVEIKLSNDPLQAVISEAPWLML